MALNAGCFARCLKCGTEFDEDEFWILIECQNCQAPCAEAIGIPEEIAKQVFNFCQNECAYPPLALIWCSVQFDGVNQFLLLFKKYHDEVFEGAAQEVLARVDIEQLHNGPKCESCKKYLLGHPQGRTICQGCIMTRKLWNAELSDLGIVPPF